MPDLQFRPMKLSSAVFLLIANLGSAMAKVGPAMAECETKIINSDGRYRACELILQVKDKKTGRPFSYSQEYGEALLTKQKCARLCKSYQHELNRLDHADMKTFERLRQEDNSLAATAATTNTTPLLGVYNGKLDYTEGFAAFSDVILKFDLVQKEGQRNIDLGGGKFNQLSALLRSFGLLNYVYDPYGRSQHHNGQVLKGKPYDSATSMSILNVITSREQREMHIRLAESSLKCNGFAYFKVYEGNRSMRPEEFQMNQETEFYLNEVAQVFGSNNARIFKANHLIMAQKKCSADSKEPSSPLK